MFPRYLLDLIISFGSGLQLTIYDCLASTVRVPQKWRPRMQNKLQDLRAAIARYQQRALESAILNSIPMTITDPTEALNIAAAYREGLRRWFLRTYVNEFLAQQLQPPRPMIECPRLPPILHAYRSREQLRRDREAYWNRH